MTATRLVLIIYSAIVHARQGDLSRLRVTVALYEVLRGNYQRLT